MIYNRLLYGFIIETSKKIQPYIIIDKVEPEVHHKSIVISPIHN